MTNEEKVVTHYTNKKWGKKQLRDAVEHGWCSKETYKNLTGEEYAAEETAKSDSAK